MCVFEESCLLDQTHQSDLKSGEKHLHLQYRLIFSQNALKLYSSHTVHSLYSRKLLRKVLRKPKIYSETAISKGFDIISATP